MIAEGLFLMCSRSHLLCVCVCVCVLLFLFLFIYFFEKGMSWGVIFIMKVKVNFVFQVILFFCILYYFFAFLLIT